MQNFTVTVVSELWHIKAGKRAENNTYGYHSWLEKSVLAYEMILYIFPSALKIQAPGMEMCTS